MRFRVLFLWGIAFGIILLVSGCIDSDSHTAQPYTQSSPLPDVSESEPITSSEPLWSLDGTITQLTSGNHYQKNPIWSPDGQMLVYEQSEEIWAIDISDNNWFSKKS